MSDTVDVSGFRSVARTWPTPGLACPYCKGPREHVTAMDCAYGNEPPGMGTVIVCATCGEVYLLMYAAIDLRRGHVVRFQGVRARDELRKAIEDAMPAGVRFERDLVRAQFAAKTPNAGGA